MSDWMSDESLPIRRSASPAASSIGGSSIGSTSNSAPSLASAIASREREQRRRAQAAAQQSQSTQMDLGSPSSRSNSSPVPSSAPFGSSVESIFGSSQPRSYAPPNRNIVVPPPGSSPSTSPPSLPVSSSDAVMDPVDEDADLALARRLQREEEEAARLRRGGNRAPVFSRAGSAYASSGAGAGARSGNAPARAASEAGPVRASWGGLRAAGAASSSAAAAGRPESQEERDFLLAQRLEQQDLIRLQEEDRARARAEAQERRAREATALQRALEARTASQGNNSREPAANAAGGGSRSRLGSRGRHVSDEDSDDFDPDEVIEVAASPRESAMMEEQRRRGGGGGGARGSRGGRHPWGRRPSYEYEEADLPPELEFLMAQLSQGMRGGGGGMGGGEVYQAIMQEIGNRLHVGGGRGGGGFRARRGDALDVDNMSYEDLLALGERIGEVKSKGLTKAEIKLLPVTKFVREKKQKPNSSPPLPAAASSSNAAAASSNSRRVDKRKSDDENSDDASSDVMTLDCLSDQRPTKKKKTGNIASHPSAASASVKPFTLSPHKPIFPTYFQNQMHQQQQKNANGHLADAAAASNSSVDSPPPMFRQSNGKNKFDVLTAMDESEDHEADQQERKQIEAAGTLNERIAKRMSAAVKKLEREEAAAKQQQPASTLASSPTSSPAQEDEYEEVSCSICLCELEEGDSVKRLSCLHVFHAKELDKWLLQNKVCPICRVPALPQ